MIGILILFFGFWLIRIFFEYCISVKMKRRVISVVINNYRINFSYDNFLFLVFIFFIFCRFFKLIYMLNNWV